MNQEILLQEVSYKATRSSGPGGQHVNKTSTRVEIYWNLEESEALNVIEKERLREILANKINREGQLILSASTSRSQYKNKKEVTDKLLNLLAKGLVIPKKRKKAKVPLAVKRKRLADKKLRSETKANRRKPEF